MFPSTFLPGLAALVLTTLAAHAQPGARPDPLDPTVAVPAPALVTAIPRGAPAAANPPLSWRDANDAVARIGGWRVYAREGRPPDPAPAALPQPHTGHRSP